MEPGHDILDVHFFDWKKLPSLSTDRNTHSQINMIFKKYHDNSAATEFD